MRKCKVAMNKTFLWVLLNRVCPRLTREIFLLLALTFFKYKQENALRVLQCPFSYYWLSRLIIHRTTNRQYWTFRGVIFKKIAAATD